MAYISVPMLDYVKAELVGNCIVVLFVLIIVALRIGSRVFLGSGMGWDDGLIAAAVPLGITLLAMQGLFSATGNGYPFVDVMVNAEFILVLTVVFQVVYLAMLGLVKMSILCFYLRCFIDKGTKLAVKMTMGLVAAWALAHILTVFLICQPFESEYNLSVTGQCGNQISLFESILSTSIITDAIIIILPMYRIWHLQMRRADKIGLSAAFLIGLADIAAAIVRIVYVTSVDITGDLTGTMPTTIFLATFEPNLAILCASIPMLRPIYGRYRTGATSSKISDDLNAKPKAAGSPSDSGDSHKRDAMVKRPVRGPYSDFELDTVQSHHSHQSSHQLSHQTEEV